MLNALMLEVQASSSAQKTLHWSKAQLATMSKRGILESPAPAKQVSLR